MSQILVEREVGVREALSEPQLGKPPSVIADVLGLFDLIARNMFGLDYRSLGLARIAFGACLLWVAIGHGWEYRAFYTDEGVLTRQQLFDHPLGYLGFSLHFANGDRTYIVTLFVIQIILAFTMMVGYRTRLSTIGSYLLLLSMQNRQPIIIYGADIALRVGMFWAMFMPLGYRLSVDRLIGRLGPEPAKPYLGIAGIAFIVQVCSIYTCGALMKVGASWQVDHDAVAYALALDCYSRPLGQWLGQIPWLTTLLTIFTLKMELYGPLLFVPPIFNQWPRLLGVLLFAGLQIGFNSCMTLGYFGAVMITLTLVFLPPIFWTYFAFPLGRKVAAKLRLPAIAMTPFGKLWWKWIMRERAKNMLNEPVLRSRGIRYGWTVLKLARDGVLAYLLWVIVLVNVGNMPGKQIRISESTDAMTYTLGINQRWDMFSPIPQTVDGWFVVAGTLKNGQVVDMMSGANPVSYEKPVSVSDSYQGQVWMSYLISFWSQGASNPEQFTYYLRQAWNEHHRGDEQIQSIEIDMMYEEVEDGPSKSDVTRSLVWVEWF